MDSMVSERGIDIAFEMLDGLLRWLARVLCQRRPLVLLRLGW
jgi:hypothetical protein